ncbi:type II toxin-antitoxin system PemK/MazF family toxin [Candidatus Woesearchaeota archaeon]|nr:type II toxin-antitoxin system PemK/MazF family toxin [Candidatus Woesearchaeota archaeon]
MEKLVKGDVVVLPFPYSDLSSSKKRPALIIAILGGDDVVLCQITSRQRDDRYSINLKDADFKQGKLDLESYIRPNRIFTADKSIILYKIGSLKENKIQEVIEGIIEILKQ